PPRRFGAGTTGWLGRRGGFRPPKPPSGWPRMSPPVAWYFRSFPAENARSPAPVMIPIQRSGSPANSSHTFASSRFAGGGSEFITSGRVIVTTRSRPRRPALPNFGLRKGLPFNCAPRAPAAPRLRGPPAAGLAAPPERPHSTSPFG